MSAVACHVDRGSCCSSPGRLSLWYKSSWRRLQLAPQQSHQAGDPQTGEQLQQRSSHTVAKILRPTTDFSTWGSSKGTENPQGILLWGPVGFHDRISTGLGKQRLLEGTKNLKENIFKKCAHQEPGDRSCNPRRDWLRLACVCPGSPVEAWVNCRLPWGLVHWLQQFWEAPCAGINPSEGDNHYCNYHYHSLAWCQTREHSPTHQQKIPL